MCAEFFRKKPADAGGDGSVLQQERTLEKLATVKAAAQHKVAVEQCSGLFEQIENVFHVPSR
jgi:hypothetical protein